MEPTQREIYDARLDEMREATRERARLVNKVEQPITEAALLSMAIRSAEEAAS
jgi:hypothetical protein